MEWKRSSIAPPVEREPSQFMTEVVVPTGQALSFGGLMTLATWLAAGAFGWTWSGYHIGLAGAGTACLWWLASQGVFTFERWTGRDVTGDGVAGPPGSGYVLVNAGKQPTPDEALRQRLVEFARAAAVSTARRRLKRLGFERPEQERLRALLIRGGMAVWNSSDNRSTTAGWHLTKTPREIRARLL